MLSLKLMKLLVAERAVLYIKHIVLMKVERCVFAGSKSAIPFIQVFGEKVWV